MKKLRILFLLCATMVVHAVMALTTPEFGSNTYYVIQFTNSQLYLTAAADNANLTTQKGTITTVTDKQLWKFVGTKSNFQLVNKAGQYAVYSSDRIKAASSQDASGWSLNEGNTYFELK